MATKTKKPARKSTRKIISSKASPIEKVKLLLSKKPVFISLAVIVGLMGVYLLNNGFALSGGIPGNDAARGLVYKGLKKDSHGHCGGAFVDEDTPEGTNPSCTHPDPGPNGIDLRNRDKVILGQLKKQADYDSANLQTGQGNGVRAGAPDASSYAEATITGWDLSEVAGRNWKCPGTGVEGMRVQWIYAYKSGASNRLSDLRSSFASIARRVNAVVYNSSMESTHGNVSQQVRYATQPDCGLTISAVPITGDIGSFANVRTQVQAKGYDSVNRKYIISVDAGGDSVPCALSQVWNDDRHTVDNANNKGKTYAAIWRPCWNYAEPHELSHMLGSVQLSAPHATASYHCKDENDTMCYKDASNVNLSTDCPSQDKKWIFDCGFNDYYNHSANPGRYLETHWNTADSGFLTNSDF